MLERVRLFVVGLLYFLYRDKLRALCDKGRPLAKVSILLFSPALFNVAAENFPSRPESFLDYVVLFTKLGSKFFPPSNDIGLTWQSRNINIMTAKPGKLLSASSWKLKATKRQFNRLLPRSR